MKNKPIKKFYLGIEISWNSSSAWEILGFFRRWKWLQYDRYGYSFSAGNLVIIIG